MLYRASKDYCPMWYTTSRFHPVFIRSFIAIAGSCSQWDIYDDYCKDIEAQKAQEQQNKKKSVGAKKTKSQQTEAVQNAASNTQSKSKDDVVSLRAAKVVERMTMQNIFDEVIMDLKYWEDHSDEFRFPSESSMSFYSCIADLMKPLCFHCGPSSVTIPMANK